MRLKKLGKIFEKYQKGLFALAISITKNRALAEDVIHDALIAVADVKGEPANLKNYFFQTVKNKAIHSTKYNQKLSQLEEDYVVTCAPLAENQLLFSRIKVVIKLLPSQQQQVLIMKLFGGLKFKEIAEIIDRPINTVTSQYRRGLQFLQERLNEN